MKRSVLAAVLFTLLLVACGGGDDAATTEAGDAGAQAEGAAADSDTTVDEAAVEDSARSASGLSAGGAAVSSGEAPAVDGDDAGAPPIEPLPDPPAMPTGDRVIKEGTITIEVEADGFDQAYTRVIEAARRNGGDVVGSSTRTNDRGDTFGSITVRVPVRSFEDLMVGVGDIGTIRDRDVNSQDVSAEFTDLESRLRHLRAQERFYLGLLDEAESVSDAIAVQQQLNGIQSQIEQIQGRLNLLDDRTTFSTLTVELFEPGAGTALTQEEDPEARPTLAHYWDTARDAFVNVIGAMLVAGLFALPLLIVAGALWVGYRTLVRPAAPRRAPRPEQQEREPVSADS